MKLINSMLTILWMALISGCYSCPEVEEQFISDEFKYYTIINEDILTTGELIVNKIQTDSFRQIRFNKPVVKMVWLDYNEFPDTIILVQYYNSLITPYFENCIIVDSSSVVNINQRLITIPIDEGISINIKLRVPHRMCYRQITIF